MFDLDYIEQDYLKNSFRLTEEEIIDIYQSENATLSVYEKELENYRKKSAIFFMKLLKKGCCIFLEMKLSKRKLRKNKN